MACIFVASKVEETVKKFRELMIVAWPLMAHTSPVTELDADSPMVEEARKRVMAIELELLELMDFDFEVSHPHPIMAQILSAKQGEIFMMVSAYF